MTLFTPQLMLDELLAMPAGRELDAALHGTMGKRWEHDAVGRPYRLEGGLPRWTFAVPHYSTLIADAWPLLAEMLEAGESISLWHDEKDGLALMWVEGWHIENVPPIADAPLAICRAWLAWKLGPSGTMGAGKDEGVTA